MQAKEVQKEDILKLGKALYNKAMQNVRAIIEQKKQLQKENGRLTAGQEGWINQGTAGATWQSRV